MPEQDAMPAGEIQQSIQPDTNFELTQSITFLFDWNAEITRLYLFRCQQYWMLPLRLRSCFTPAETQAVQADFLHRLIEDYRDAAARLSQIADVPKQPSEPAPKAEYARILLKAQEDAAAIIDQAKAQADRILASAQERAEQLVVRKEPIEQRA